MFQLSLLLLGLYFPAIINAQDSDLPNSSLIITELLPAPSQSQEWVELYNPTSSTIDIAGWSLEDQLTTPSVIAQLNGQLVPNQTLVIYLASAKLNNSADGVTLKNNSGQVIDSFSYSQSTTDLSWARYNTDPTSPWHQTQPTPGTFQPTQPPTSPSPTPTPSPSPTPSGASPSPSPNPANGVILTLSEIQGCPESSQSEWVELFNSTSAPVTIENWQIKDAANNAELISGIVPTQGYAVFSWSKSLLNNTGDSVYLITNQNVYLDSMSYQNCSTGTTISKINDQWQVSIPTPGQANALSLTNSDGQSLSELESYNVEEATNLPISSLTNLVGQPSLPWWPDPKLPELIETITPDILKPSLEFNEDAPTTQPTPPPLPNPTPSTTTPNVIIGGLLLMSGGGNMLFFALRH